MSHTPGPWRYCGQGEVCDSKNIPVADCYLRADDIDADAANGAVIAAAPDLLDELKNAHLIIRNALAVMTVEQKLQWGQRNTADGIDGEGITRAHEREALIAKAEGK